MAGLRVPPLSVNSRTWPLPSCIPWDEVQRQAWHEQGQHGAINASDATQWFSKWSRAVERSLNGFVGSTPNQQLPSQCHGRGQMLEPRSDRPIQRVKDSRPGEEELRHDGLCQEVVRWFRQIRCLQSLSHAVRAGKQEAAAVEYRCHLWSAIIEAKGFRGGFRAWWGLRPIQHVGSPGPLPWCVPDEGSAHRIFTDFRANFRKLEHWHLQQRQKVLQCKHDAGMAQLYQELRAPRPEQVDSLTLRHEYEVVDAEEATGQICVDPIPDFRGSSDWTLEDSTVLVAQVDGPICTVQADVFPEPGQVLDQVQTLVDVSDIQQEFVSLWFPRWNKQAEVPAHAWERITAFVDAYFLPGHVCLPPLSVDAWNRALKRFKPQAARGPDGWAKDDLLHLPRERTEQLLGLLSRIEQGVLTWPAQLLEGLVCALDKGTGRQDANGFRPIVLYSVIYRCWSGIRARQLLRRLRDKLPPDLLGFVPGHETCELWYGTQMQVELCCQGGLDYCGRPTDVVKAFNQLPRPPVFHIAKRVGIPEQVTRPWQLFLAGMTRRPEVRDQVSHPLLSVTSSEGGPALSLGNATGGLGLPCLCSCVCTRNQMPVFRGQLVMHRLQNGSSGSRPQRHAVLLRHP